jgi:hypothetical protein
MSTNVPKKDSRYVRAPWRCSQPDAEGTVRIYDKNGLEILMCEATIGSIIVRAVNWCASRGYL